MPDNLSHLKLKFFFERAKELLHKKTIDTYRIRVMNPRQILIELEKVILEFQAGRITRFNPTVSDVAREAALLLNKDDGLVVRKIRKDAAVSIFGNEKHPLSEKAYKRASMIARLILDENTSYRDELIDVLKNILTTEEEADEDELLKSLEIIDRLSGFLFTEFTHQGFSRKYLKDKILEHVKRAGDELNLGAFEHFLGDVQHEERPYQVYYKLHLRGQVKKYPILSPDISLLETLEENELSLRKEHAYFHKVKPGDSFLRVDVYALDFTAALKIAEQEVSECLDIINMAFDDPPLYLNSKACVKFSLNNAYRIFSRKVQLDGGYEYDEDLFNHFIEKLSDLRLDDGIRNKLLSAIRYLRLGNASHEIEHKFLNYWIGMEYLFANHDSDANSIQRIKTFYPKMHSVFYANRLLNYLITTIRRFQLQKQDGSSYSMEEFKDEAAFENLIGETINDAPFVAFRAHQLRQIFFTNRGFKDTLKRHNENLNLHLTRIYRIRNEIVHEASVKQNIEIITSNLKYYLIFSIERIVWAMDDHRTLNTIEDVFIFHEMVYDNIQQMQLSEIIDLQDFKTIIE